MEWHVIGMGLRSASTADKIICRVKTRHLNELRELRWIQLEVFHCLDGAFDIFQRDENLNELFL